jgi:hypothetical protein
MEATAANNAREKLRQEQQESKENQGAARRAERETTTEPNDLGEANPLLFSSSSSAADSTGASSSSSGGGLVRNWEDEDSIKPDPWMDLAQRFKDSPTQGEKCWPDNPEEEGSNMENSEVVKFHDDFRWEIGEVSDMTEPDNIDVRQFVTDMQYYDKYTWEELGPKRAEVAEQS